VVKSLLYSFVLTRDKQGLFSLEGNVSRFGHKTMGAASSTETHTKAVKQYRQTVLEGKPLDASDVKVRTLQEVCCL
jgi:hypothetical protein